MSMRPAPADETTDDRVGNLRTLTDPRAGAMERMAARPEYSHLTLTRVSVPRSASASFCSGRSTGSESTSSGIVRANAAIRIRRIAMDSKKVSIIVPCYNEQDALPLFYKELTRVLASLHLDYEILFVDDGSRDNTLRTIKQLDETDSHVRYISFSRNFGKEAAMYAGFRNAAGDYVAVMDADMQDPPSLLPQMLEILQTQEYDSVATRREDRRGEKRIRSWFSHVFYKVINRISDADIVEGARDFRLMTRNMADAVAAMGERERFSKGIFGWVGFRTYWLSFPNEERVAGETKWSFWKLARYAVDGIVNFSNEPLNFVSWIGIVMTGISFAALLFVVIRRLILGDPVAGWASTICIIVFIGGIQLLCLGIMGQYLSRIYLESKRRPYYIVAETDLEDVR